MSTVDANTLQWVKSEIDETLKQAQVSLEAYVEDTADESQLRFCINYLHQVHGTLQMVELHGAALAIEEMEKLSQAIFDDNVSNKDDAYETLMRGILQVPDYLEHLLAGNPDMPVVLLPLLNDIRAARNEALLSEGALFTPDLSVEAPAVEFTESSGEDGGLPALARKLRHNYHLGLLSWFQNKNPKAGLQKISDVISELTKASESDESRRVFWIANGLVESLKDGGVDTSVSVKMLMGHVDRQIKKIIDKGEQALDEAPPEELEKNLLYYIASSTTSGESTKEIKEAFHLKDIMPDTMALEQARADLTAPNAALMGTVSLVIIEDINKIKDNLDMFVRSDEKDTSMLEDVHAALTQMGDTLAMLNLGVQREAVLKQSQVIGDIVSGALVADEAELMNVAAAMIAVENSLSEVSTAKAASSIEVEEGIDAGDAALAQMQGAEQQKLMQTVLDEAKIDLAKVKDALTVFSQNNAEREQLNTIPPLLEQIQGSLMILSLSDAGNLLTLTNNYIRNTLIKDTVPPSSDDMNNLADAISSLEYYMESLMGSWGQPEAILNVAIQSLQDLGINTDAVAVPEEEVSEEELPEDIFDVSGIPEQDSIDLSIEGDSLEMVGDDLSFDLELTDTTTSLESDGNEIILDDIALEDDSLEMVGDDLSFDLELTDTTTPLESDGDEIILDEIALEDVSTEGSLLDDVLEFELDNESSMEEKIEPIHMEPITAPPAVEIEPIQVASSTPPAKASEPSLLDDTIDDEIIEIFLEEAEEAFETISEHLPMWVANTTNDEPLKEIRRAYHTLKGSGRLVGALDLGEFAWAIENMLNRVLDNTIKVNPEVLELMERSKMALPELFELFKVSGKPGPDILVLMEYADALSKGQPVNLNEPLSTESDTDDGIDELVIEAGNEALLPVDIDPVLLEIYRKEVATHVDTLRTYVSSWHDGHKGPEQSLLRALHTITGSSRTTGVNALATLCSRFEHYVKDLQDNELLFPQIALTELEKLIPIIENDVDKLDKPGEILSEHKDLLASIEALPLDISSEDEVSSRNDDAMVEELTLGTLDIGDSGVEELTFDISDIEDPAIEELTFDISDFEEPAVEELVLDVPVIDEPVIEAPVFEASMADYDEELLEIFLEEGTEILDETDQVIVDWIANPGDPEFVKELQRQLHTLKGGARMAGIAELGDLGHSIESLLTAVVDGHMQATKPMFDLVQRSQDRLVKMLERVQDHKGLAAATDLLNEVDSMLQNRGAVNDIEEEEVVDVVDVVETVSVEETTDELSSSSISIEIPELEKLEEELRLEVEGSISSSDFELPEITEDASTSKSDAENVISLDLDTAVEPLTKEVAVENKKSNEPADDSDRRKGGRVQTEQVRVRADLLDNLVNFAGEVSIYRSRLEQQTNNFRYNITEFDDTVSRLRDQLRQFEIETETQIEYKNEELSSAQESFDPLEMDRFTTMQHLSRAMMESLGDLDSLRGILNNLTRESETLLLQQSRVNTDLQEGLMRTRMVPFSGQAARLRRIVRQTCGELGKHAELHLDGVDSELDRTVLERIISPIEHMLRNAVAHGIESPDAREKAGKPREGNIHFTISNEGSEILIKIKDDGAGINLEAIRSKAVSKGLLKTEDAASKEILLDMIMQSGFSTAEAVSQIAGRGVGMDVVNTEIKQLGGVFNIDTEDGKGCTFTVSLPLTLAITRALMVMVGDDTYAIPLLSVEGVERVNVAKVKEIMASDEKTYNWVDEDYKFMHLGTVMGVNQMVLADDQQQISMLMVRSGEHRAAILVDALLGSREIVVKSVGPQLSTLRGISGATVMGDGSVVLIIDLAMLIRLEATADKTETMIPVATIPQVEENTNPLVMVVDDSITVRKVTTRLLDRHEMRVVQAKDGVDALAQLQEIIPDIMLLDVEMPRMDGFELATNMRNDERLNKIPIIMITSRTGQKHRDRAASIGVNIYMGKPFTETDLLDNINVLTGQDL